MREIERTIRDIFTDLGRFRAVRLRSIREARGQEPIDYIAHFISTKPIKHTTTKSSITTKIWAY